MLLEQMTKDGCTFASLGDAGKCQVPRALRSREQDGRPQQSTLRHTTTADIEKFDADTVGALVREATGAQAQERSTVIAPCEASAKAPSDFAGTIVPSAHVLPNMLVEGLLAAAMISDSLSELSSAVPTSRGLTLERDTCFTLGG